MSDIVRAFPTPIYERTVQDDFSILNDYKTYGSINTDEGWKTVHITTMCPVRILELPELIGVKRTINVHFAEFLRELGVENTSFVMTTSWITRLLENRHIHSHNHTNSWFSGLLYFDGDYTDAVPLLLQRPQALFSSFSIPMYDEWNHAVGHTITPSHNKLVFFPSYLTHKTEANISKNIRYSLAFNFFPKGKLGNISQDSYLDTEWLNS